jgi:hypothetical protein
MCATSNAASSSACTGANWFKGTRHVLPARYTAAHSSCTVYENPPVYSSSSHSLTFPSTSMTTISFTIPKSVPSGQYLVRAEQAALHVASTYGGTQVSPLRFTGPELY